MLLTLETYDFGAGPQISATVRAMVRDRFGEVFANGAICAVRLSA